MAEWQQERRGGGVEAANERRSARSGADTRAEEKAQTVSTRKRAFCAMRHRWTVENRRTQEEMRWIQACVPLWYSHPRALILARHRAGLWKFKRSARDDQDVRRGAMPARCERPPEGQFALGVDLSSGNGASGGGRSSGDGCAKFQTAKPTTPATAAEAPCRHSRERLEGASGPGSQ